MSNFGKLKIEAVVITAIFIASLLAFPMTSAIEKNTVRITDLVDFNDEGEPVFLDTYYVEEQGPLFVGDKNDIDFILLVSKLCSTCANISLDVFFWYSYSFIYILQSN